MSDWWTDFDDDLDDRVTLNSDYIETHVAPCGFCGETTRDHMILVRFADDRPVLATELVADASDPDHTITNENDWSGSRVAWGRMCGECYEQLAFGEHEPVMGDGALAIARGLNEQALETGEIA